MRRPTRHHLLGALALTIALVGGLAPAAAAGSSPYSGVSSSGAAPTPAAQPTVLSTATVNLITNGGFETGDFTGWTVLNMTTPLCAWNVRTTAMCYQDPPPTGPLAAPEKVKYADNGFDGAGPGDYVLYQDVTIPATGSYTLSWWDYVTWNFCCGPTLPRTATVEIRDPATDAALETVYTFTTGAVPGSIGDTGWILHSADVSKYAGQKVRIAFRQNVPENFTGWGSYDLDDVRLTTAHLSIRAPKRVPRGTKAAVRGKLAFDDTSCDSTFQTLTVKVGKRVVEKNTDFRGHYSLKVRVRSKTKVKVSFAGEGICAAASAKKTIRVA